jgi:hypothetical protein
LKLTSRFNDTGFPVHAPVEATTQVYVTRLTESTMLWYGQWFQHGAVLKRVDSVATAKVSPRPGPLVGLAGVNQGMGASSR